MANSECHGTPANWCGFGRTRTLGCQRQGHSLQFPYISNRNEFPTGGQDDCQKLERRAHQLPGSCAANSGRNLHAEYIVARSMATPLFPIDNDRSCGRIWRPRQVPSVPLGLVTTASGTWPWEFDAKGNKRHAQLQFSRGEFPLLGSSTIPPRATPWISWATTMSGFSFNKQSWLRPGRHSHPGGRLCHAERRHATKLANAVGATMYQISVFQNRAPDHLLILQA